MENLSAASVLLLEEPAVPEHQRLGQLKMQRALSLLHSFLDKFEVKTGQRKHGERSRGAPVSLNITVVAGQSFQMVAYQNDTVGSLRKTISERYFLYL